MKTVAEHKAMCLSVAKALPPYSVTLSGAVGCILAQDVYSRIDVPATDLVACDGYAVIAADTYGASVLNPVELQVLAELRPGVLDIASVVNGSAVKVTRGMPLPIGADAVIPLSYTDQGTVSVRSTLVVNAGDNINAKAQDLAAGTVILTAGTRIFSRHIAVLAAAGHDTVLVHPKPRVVIMAIGNELQAPGLRATSDKVYDANSHALAAAARDAGADVFRFGIVPDDIAVLRESLQDQLVRADILLTAGGLSADTGNTLKEILQPLGGVRFDTVALAPGMQIGVGVLDKTTIICLPGTPTEALICFEVFVRPALRQMAGYTHLERRTLRAASRKGWYSPPGYRQYVPARASGTSKTGYFVEPLGETGNTLLSHFSQANCFMVIPEDTTVVKIGDSVECIAVDR